MADVKQILVVDDHFEMLEMLRSMLEISSKDHQVLAVPSAEEGLLELRLTNFDLLITDVRLPGMSGFDLVKQIKRTQPNLPVIMITAYSSDQGKKEAEALGIFRYFEKPLDTDSMLTAVQYALYGEPETTINVPEPVSLKVDVEISDEIKQRLDSLRIDTGAFGLMLAAAGQVVFESGTHRDLHVDKVAAIVGQKLSHSSMLAAELGGGDAFNLLYQSGATYEFYTVNIGRHYFITLLFEASSRRGRIGTVWLFVQRMIQDLEDILPDLQVETAVSSVSVATGPLRSPEDRKKPRPKPIQKSADKPRAKRGAPKPLPRAVFEEPKPSPKPEPIELSPEEMAKFEGLFSTMDPNANASLDLDNFWDTAVSENDDPNAGQSISLEDAQKMGLISSGLDLPSATNPEPQKAEETQPEEEAEPEPPELINDGKVEGLDDLFTNFEGGGGVDLDDFWDSATAENEVGKKAGGISFEEARKQGLLGDADLGK